MKTGSQYTNNWGRLVLVCLALGMLFSPQRAVQAQETYCAATPQPVATPLSDLGSGVYIRMDGQNTGFSGGLYPGGSNTRPPAHEAAGVAIGNQVTPLNSSGAPDPQNGKIVMISVGMSNTAMEFNTFMTSAQADPDLNPQLLLVNGAQSGQTADAWVDPNAPAWQELSNRLAHADVTAQQVQVAWVKLTRTGPGDFPDKAQVLQGNLLDIMHNLKDRFANIRLVYLSSRTDSYTYWNGLSPEPAAYETGFAVKWLIENQIDGDPSLNYNPANGPVLAPYLSWGPYLWANGPAPRSDGLVWLQEDMLQDCTHPSTNGRGKVADLLLNFFKTDTTSGWFLDSDAPPPTSTPTPTPSPTPSPTPPPPEYHIYLPKLA